MNRRHLRLYSVIIMLYYVYITWIFFSIFFSFLSRSGHIVNVIITQTNVKEKKQHAHGVKRRRNLKNSTEYISTINKFGFEVLSVHAHCRHRWDENNQNKNIGPWEIQRSRDNSAYRNFRMDGKFKCIAITFDMRKKEKTQLKFSYFVRLA